MPFKVLGMGYVFWNDACTVVKTKIDEASTYLQETMGVICVDSNKEIYIVIHNQSHDPDYLEKDFTVIPKQLVSEVKLYEPIKNYHY